MAEVTYIHRTNVHYLPSAHAVRNALQSAQLLEHDRRDTRRLEIRQLVEVHQREIDKRQKLIEALWAEDELLDASFYG